MGLFLGSYTLSRHPHSPAGGRGDGRRAAGAGTGRSHQAARCAVPRPPRSRWATSRGGMAAVQRGSRYGRHARPEVHSWCADRECEIRLDLTVAFLQHSASALLYSAESGAGTGRRWPVVLVSPWVASSHWMPGGALWKGRGRARAACRARPNASALLTSRPLHVIPAEVLSHLAPISLAAGVHPPWRQRDRPQDTQHPAQRYSLLLLGLGVNRLAVPHVLHTCRPTAPHASSARRAGGVIASSSVHRHGRKLGRSLATKVTQLELLVRRGV